MYFRAKWEAGGHKHDTHDSSLVETGASSLVERNVFLCLLEHSKPLLLPSCHLSHLFPFKPHILELSSLAFISALFTQSLSCYGLASYLIPTQLSLAKGYQQPFLFSKFSL